LFRKWDKPTDPNWIALQMGTSVEMLFRHYNVSFERARQAGWAKAVVAIWSQ
jgi:hypothetical protein